MRLPLRGESLMGRERHAILLIELRLVATAEDLAEKLPDGRQENDRTGDHQFAPLCQDRAELGKEAHFCGCKSAPAHDQAGKAVRGQLVTLAVLGIGLAVYVTVTREGVLIVWQH